MKKRWIAILLTTLTTVALSVSPVLAAQPEIIWLEDPADNLMIRNYVTDYNGTGPYERAIYGDGLYAVRVQEGALEYTALSPDGAGTFLTGYVNQQGQWAIQPVYNWGNSFSQGVALVGQSMEEKRNGGTYGWTADRVIDMNGTPIAAFDELDQQGYSMTQVQNGYVLLSHRASIEPPIYYGIADLSGNLILPVTFLNAQLPQDEWFLAQTEGGYGFWDITGNAAISPQYENAQGFSEGLAAVQQDGKWGFVDKTGEMVIAPAYEEAQSFCEGLAAVKINSLWGFINASGELAVPAQYEAAQNFSEGVAAVQQNNKWGCINQKGDTILPCSYEEIQPCSDNRIPVKWQGRYGYFDSTGEKIIDFLYGAATEFHEGLAAVSTGDFSGSNWTSYWYINATVQSYNNNRFGVIDRWGNSILPSEYIGISDFEDGTAICQRSDDGAVGIIQAPAIAVDDPGQRGFIRLYLNDRLLNTDQSPVIQNSRTLVPLRTIAEALDADVSWNSDSKIVTIQTDSDTIQLTAGRNMATVNGSDRQLDAPAQILGGRTMVPLRFIAEQLDAQVQWDGSTRSVRMESFQDSQ